MMANQDNMIDGCIRPLAVDDLRKQPFEDAETDSRKAQRLANYFAKKCLLRHGSRAQFTADEPSTVVALCGSWGSGKTTFLSQVVAELDKVLPRVSGDRRRPAYSGSLEREACANPQILYFNPWVFNSVEMILREFFAELERSYDISSTVGRGHYDAERSVKQLWADYGSAFIADLLGGASEAVVEASPAVVRPVLARLRAGRLVSAITARGRSSEHGPAASPSLGERRERLRAALADRDILPRLIIIDNIDRLADEEIQVMFRFIGAVLDLPKIHFLTAFDRSVVVRSLNKIQNAGGEAYLDKIIDFYIVFPRLRLWELVGSYLGQASTSFSGMDEGHQRTISKCFAALLGTMRAFNRIVLECAGYALISTGLDAPDRSLKRLLRTVVAARSQHLADMLLSTSANDIVQRVPSLLGIEEQRRADEEQERADGEMGLEEKPDKTEFKIAPGGDVGKAGGSWAEDLGSRVLNERELVSEYLSTCFPESSDKVDWLLDQLRGKSNGRLEEWIDGPDGVREPDGDELWFWLALRLSGLIEASVSADASSADTEEADELVFSRPAEDRPSFTGSLPSRVNLV